MEKCSKKSESVASVKFKNIGSVHNKDHVNISNFSNVQTKCQTPNKSNFKEYKKHSITSLYSRMQNSKMEEAPNSNIVQTPQRKETGGYKCRVCFKKFHQKINIELHIKTHHLKKEFRCNYCKSIFPKQHQLKNHMEVNALN